MKIKFKAILVVTSVDTNIAKFPTSFSFCQGKRKKEKLLTLPQPLAKLYSVAYCFSCFGHRAGKSFHTQVLIRMQSSYKLLQSKAITRTQGYIWVCHQFAKISFLIKLEFLSKLDLARNCPVSDDISPSSMQLKAFSCNLCN